MPIRDIYKMVRQWSFVYTRKTRSQSLIFKKTKHIFPRRVGRVSLWCGFHYILTVKYGKKVNPKILAVKRLVASYVILSIAERKIQENVCITECGRFIFNSVIISYNSKGSSSTSPIQYLAVFHFQLSLYCHH